MKIQVANSETQRPNRGSAEAEKRRNGETATPGFPDSPIRPFPVSPVRLLGMTLVELIIAMGIFAGVSVGLLYTHLFCLRQDQLTNSKLGASDQSRRSFGLLNTDVRAAKIWDIGNSSDGSTFTEIADGTPQQGNALRLSYSTNITDGVLYYFDTSNMANEGGKLIRIRQSDGDTRQIANYLTNNMFFRVEDYRGVTMTTRTHKAVIKVLMEFAQYQYPLTKVGPGYFYDYYKMEFKLTSHVPDGP